MDDIGWYALGAAMVATVYCATPLYVNLTSKHYNPNYENTSLEVSFTN